MSTNGHQTAHTGNLRGNFLGRGASLKNRAKVVVVVISLLISGIISACNSPNAASLQKAAMYREYGLIEEAKRELIEVIFSRDSQADKEEAYRLLGDIAFAVSLQKAAMYREYGLIEEAKRELIEVIFSRDSQADKAEAHYLLGSIAFDEGRFSVALNSWKTLVAEFPESDQAELVRENISELTEVVDKSAESVIENALAQHYLRHADFWSAGRDRVFSIDSSWISKVESAVKWYDKVLAEFPGTSAAEHAYEGKLRTLIGWKDSGRYGEHHGVERNFSKYIPQLVETFAAFERDFPEAASLQAFRYQIAQSYWNNKDWKNTRKWLSRIVEKAGDQDSFYKDLAERRLQKVEY